MRAFWPLTHGRQQHGDVLHLGHVVERRQRELVGHAARERAGGVGRDLLLVDARSCPWSCCRRSGTRPRRRRRTCSRPWPWLSGLTSTAGSLPTESGPPRTVASSLPSGPGRCPGRGTAISRTAASGVVVERHPGRPRRGLDDRARGHVDADGGAGGEQDDEAGVEEGEAPAVHLRRRRGGAAAASVTGVATCAPPGSRRPRASGAASPCSSVISSPFSSRRSTRIVRDLRDRLRGSARRTCRPRDRRARRGARRAHACPAGRGPARSGR